MIKTISEHSSQYIKDPVTGLSHRRQQAVSIDGVSEAMLLEMRELVLWFAYRLDVGQEGFVENHLLAVTLRSVADTYYRHKEDFATYLAEELAEAGDPPAVLKIDQQLEPIDVRFLDLDDGFAVLHDSFNEMLIGDQPRHPMLEANAADTLDFVFPDGAIKTHGVKGLRVSKIDFINWLMHVRVYEDAYRPFEDVFARYLVQREENVQAYEQRIKDKYGEDAFNVPTRVGPPLSDIDAHSILKELAGLTT